MSIFQLLATIFALFMLYIVNIHRKKAALSKLEIVFWYITWSAFIIIALFPNLLIGVVNIIHFARVFDLLTVLTFMILSVIIITTYFNQKETTHKIEEYIRSKALKETVKRKTKT